VRGGLMILAAMAVYVLLVFGAYSRMLEGQADLFGCRALAADRSTPPVETFISALEKLAIAGGIDRNAPSWQHASIARRISFLHRVASDPRYEESFQRRLRWAGSLIIAVVVSPLAYFFLAG
jgi:Zn-dependent protease with chaperone function